MLDLSRFRRNFIKKLDFSKVIETIFPQAASRKPQAASRKPQAI
jgi:hypothetical protein